MEIFSCPLHFNRYFQRQRVSFVEKMLKYQCLNFDSLVLEPKASLLKTILGTIHYLC